jgi:O-antigen/teichoic acid export membrane protein
MIRLRFRHIIALGGEFFWVGAGQASAVLGSLVGLRVLTNELVPAEFGSLALALTVSSLLGLTILVGPGAATLRFFDAARDRGELGGLLTGAWRSIRRRAAIVALVTALLAVPIWVLAGAAQLSLALAAVVQASFSSFATVLDGAQNGARRRRTVALHAGLSQWLRWMFALALFPMFGRSAAVTLWGYALASVAVLGSQALFFRYQMRALAVGHRSEPALAASWEARVNTYSRPIALWGLPFWLHNASERWALERFASTQTVGLYAVLAQLGFGIMTLASALVAQLISPLLFSRAGDGLSAERVRDVYRINVRIVVVCLGLTLVAAGIASVTHRFFFAWLVAPEFRSASPFWTLSILSGGMFACGQLMALTVSSGASTAPLLAPKIGGAAFGLVTTVVGAARAGLVGVIWASLASSLLYFVWTWAVARAEHGRVDRNALNMDYSEELAT